MFRSLWHLFVPRACAVCGRILVDGEYLVCTACRWEMPLTGMCADPNNPIREKLHAMFMAEQGCAMFFYRKGSGYDQLIHRFKYQGKAALSTAMGRWFGEELRHSGLYSEVDLILPVPLHPLRLVKRGYNQSEALARGIGRALKKKVRTGCLVRRTHHVSQTHRNSADRWENVAGIFGIRRPERLAGKHILLVDDVMTTGATLESCADTLRRAVPDCRISAVTLAVSPKEFV